MRKRQVLTSVVSTALLLSLLFSSAWSTGAEEQKSEPPPIDCPVQVSGITSLSHARSGKDLVFDKAGTVYVLLTGDGIKTNVRCFMKSNGSFSEQDAGNRPTATRIPTGIDCRFDGTLIHVIYMDVGGVFSIMYVTFDTSTNLWGAPETITVGVQGTAQQCTISLDSNNKPHVVYTKGVKFQGQYHSQLKYKNKVGASWSVEEDVHVEENINHFWPTLGHESDDRFVAVWAERTNNIAYARTRSSAGVWDTIQTIKTGSLNPSLAVDFNDSKHISLVSSATLYHCVSSSGANQSWSVSAALDTNVGFAEIACKPGRTHLFIVYCETVVDDVLLVIREDTTWSDPITLQTIPGETSIVRAGVQDPTSCDDFDYIFREADDTIWWDEYQFLIFSPSVAISPGGLVF